MRTTKADIYKNHGIEYRDGHIIAPEFGAIAPVLVDGNKKIGKGCYHFSTLPTTGEFTFAVHEVEYTERGTCACTCKNAAGEVTCYATKDKYNTPGVIASLGIKTRLARRHLDFLRRAILAQIEADGVRVLRVHVAGDFFSPEYVDMWRAIARECPGVVMWTYTKVAAAENAFDDVPNFNVVKSFVPGHGNNYGECGYILALYEALQTAGKSVYICKCGMQGERHCIECGACRTCDHVLFIEHGTGYNAKKDPLYPVVKALIEAQADIEL